MICTLEIYTQGHWRKAAQFEVRTPSEVAKGYLGSGFLTYDEDYAAQHLLQQDLHALSCRYPVNYELHDGAAWPAFLLDLLPSGAARRHWLGKLAIADGPTADWPLLLQGAGNPPGNLRVAEAVAPPPTHAHAGFDRADILERQDRFMEYAQAHGAPVAGSSGAQGDAPKFLLVEDRRGKWHADGALPDREVARHWLVKFPRGKEPSDRRILRNEAAYARVAGRFGLRVAGLPVFEENVLFVPRFDREVAGDQVIRHGQESLCSLAGISEFAVRAPQQDLCRAIARHCTEPARELVEFVLRDVLNVALGNTDNHARNTSVTKLPQLQGGRIALSPLYDFAPMFLDDQGITRVCRWNGAEELGMPDWGAVAELLGEHGLDGRELRARLAALAPQVRELPRILAEEGGDADLAEQLEMRTAETSRALEAAAPRRTS